MNEILKLAQKFENKFASQNQFVYHIKNNDFKGKIIYSLSELKEIYPNIYKSQMKKYKGREDHPEIKIKILDCQWKDCISFSTLNPIKIFQMEELLGLPGYNHVGECQVLKFKLIDFDDLPYCLYDDNQSPKKNEAYSKTSIKSYKETNFIPAETTKYFAECQEKKEYPLLFGNVTHLLVKGNVDISKAEIIKYKSII